MSCLWFFILKNTEELTLNNQFLTGFSEEFQIEFEQYKSEGFQIGRVALEHKRLYRVWTESGELLCEVSGKLAFQAEGREDFPAVGDWVVIKGRASEGNGTIHAILPRKSKFSRKAAGRTTEEQIIAANIDTIFLVSSLNDDLNLRRIERYLLLAWESGANPVVILSKSDLCESLSDSLSQVESVAMGVPIIPISSLDRTGFDELNKFLKPGSTVALLGSSGVGKSTLTNALLGTEKQKIQEAREKDDKGRHTTTYREMILLPNGAVLVDTPGMRELQLWDGDEGITESFKDIELYSENCRFRDCSHKNEPGCGVREAIEQGFLTDERMNSYRKLQRELAYLDQKTDKKAALERKKYWKSINKQVKSSRK